MNKIYISKVSKSFKKLEFWLNNNGYSGYDPYDLIGQDWVKILFGTKKNNFFGICRSILWLITDKYPVFFRNILMVKPKINAKGMGLIAHSFLLMYENTNNLQYLEKAENILNWLKNNYSKSFKGYSWGYPFHWYSRIFIPKNTPSSVVTGVVADAFFKHYDLTKSKSSLKILEGINHFFNTEIKHFRTNESLCFSYTPIDDFKVHNASLFTAAFFAKYGSLSGDDEYKKKSIDAAKFTINEQQKDGSFYYWSGEKNSVVDHFHTGYVLRHLHTIYLETKEEWINDHIKLGLKYYVENLFDEFQIPVFTNKLNFPKDTHALTEALLCLNQLKSNKYSIENKVKINNILKSCIDYLIEEMQTHNGYFIYQVNRNKKVDIAYMRWCQSWVLFSFAKILNYKK